MTPLKTLPTEHRTPRSRKMPFASGGQLVSAVTVRDVLAGKYPQRETVIVDCRFGYEYEGGHLPGALNFPPNSEKALASLLFDEGGPVSRAEASDNDALVILHCEFSQCRAPRMAAELLKLGRQGIEVYVMKGGYAEFYRIFPSLCEPQGYTTM